MHNLLLGILIGSALTTMTVGAGDYLHSTPQEAQSILSETRLRQALETIEMGRQNYLDGQVRDAGKLPCR